MILGLKGLIVLSANKRETKCTSCKSKNRPDQQGLEGYSRDPGFGQNAVHDSGKRKIS